MEGGLREAGATHGGQGGCDQTFQGCDGQLERSCVVGEPPKAPNPHSVSTPVRLVWDSSREFRGVSLNGILLKGPDVLNPIRMVLLCFREGEHAAIGDVSNMYNSVWLEDQEVHVHRFLWRDSSADDIEDYALVRVNMGDKPAGCIAGGHA